MRICSRKPRRQASDGSKFAHAPHARRFWRSPASGARTFAVRPRPDVGRASAGAAPRWRRRTWHAPYAAPTDFNLSSDGQERSLTGQNADNSPISARRRWGKFPENFSLRSLTTTQRFVRQPTFCGLRVCQDVLIRSAEWRKGAASLTTLAPPPQLAAVPPALTIRRIPSQNKRFHPFRQRSFNWQSTAFVMRGLSVRLRPLALAVPRGTPKVFRRAWSPRRQTTTPVADSGRATQFRRRRIYGSVS